MNTFASFLLGLVVAGGLVLSPIGVGTAFAEDFIPNDTELAEQDYLDRIGAKGAWGIRTTAPEVVVAIIDGGVYLDHSDITDNIWINDGEVVDGIDNDGNGYIDDILGWDFVAGDNNPSPDVNEEEVDDLALHHGTVVAGIIGAVGNNGAGIAGLAWDVQLMPLRALDSVGAGTGDDVASAIYYAVNNGADIINLSLTGYETIPSLDTAIEFAYANDVVVVAALGNDNNDTNIETVYPACLRAEDSDWVIGVTSTDANNQKAGFSNYGSECSDISAPGTSIFSTIYEDVANGYVGQYLNGWNGTSFSAPMVAGAAALLLAEYPSLTPSQVQLALELGADPLNLPSEYAGRLGTGQLNIEKAFVVGDVYSEQNGGEEVVEEDSPQAELEEVGSEITYDYISGENHSAVYRVINGDRFVFLNSQTFFTWEEDFSSVEQVPDADLADYPFGGLMLPKGGTVLIQIETTNNVYSISEDLTNPLSATTLRLLPSEEVAKDLYGLNWSDYVMTVPVTAVKRFTYGEDHFFGDQVDTLNLLTREELAERAK